MITINLDTIIHEKHLIVKLFEARLDHQCPILLYDLPEGSRLWPIDIPQGDGENGKDFSSSLFSKAHKILQNHEYDVWFLCSDLNIKERYAKWCKKVGVKEKFKLLCFPFTVKLNGIDFIKQKDIDALNQTEKNKNFCQLISSPKTIRLATVDRYYKHINYEYSYVPHFHFRETAEKKQVGIPFMPYNDTDLLDYHGQYVDGKFKNGFNAETNYKTLTETKLSKGWDEFLDEGGKVVVENKQIHKVIFDTFLPLESFKSCCDVVLESYFTGPICFTEKTWKEFLFERPFIMLGEMYSNHYLQHLGFELYDEIFDYSFDLEENNLKRLKMFWDQIERYLNYDPYEFEKKLKVIDDKLKHNRQTQYFIAKHHSAYPVPIPSTYLNSTSESNDNLFNHVYLSAEFACEKYLNENDFNMLKTLCSGY